MLKRITSSVAGRRLLQLAVDGGLVALAYYLAFALRFDNGTPHRYRDLLGATILLVVAGKLLVFAAFGLYHKLWRFIDQKDFERVVQAVLVATLLVVVAFFLLPGKTDPPRGVIALDFLLTLMFISAARFAVRMLLVERTVRWVPERGAREVLIVGGGSGGQAVVSELRRNPGLRSVPKWAWLRALVMLTATPKRRAGSSDCSLVRPRTRSRGSPPGSARTRIARPS